MAEYWARRQRNTNKLVRACAKIALIDRVTPEKLHALCRLTWITKSFQDENASYIRTVKIPALIDLLNPESKSPTLLELGPITREWYGQLHALDHKC